MFQLKNYINDFYEKYELFIKYNVISFILILFSIILFFSINILIGLVIFALSLLIILLVNIYYSNKYYFNIKEKNIFSKDYKYKFNFIKKSINHNLIIKFEYRIELIKIELLQPIFYTYINFSTYKKYKKFFNKSFDEMFLEILSSLSMKDKQKTFEYYSELKVFYKKLERKNKIKNL